VYLDLVVAEEVGVGGWRPEVFSSVSPKFRTAAFVAFSTEVASISKLGYFCYNLYLKGQTARQYTAGFC